MRTARMLGVKVTLILQLPLAGTEVPQVLVWAKSVLVVMLLMLMEALLKFVRVMVCGALVPPMNW